MKLSAKLGLLLAASVLAIPLLLFAGTDRPRTGTCLSANSTTTVGGSARLTDDQAHNASVIISTARTRQLPDRAAVIGVATSLQEAGLHNLTGGDRDSLGLFQQRPSQGWGTVDQIRDPGYAAGKFFDALVKVPGWASLPLTVAAQAVQASGFPDAYAQWQPEAEQIVSGATTAACTPVSLTGAQVLPGGWADPLPGGVITQPFGVHNGHDGPGGHPGVDIAAPADTPLRAAHPGTVVFAGPASGYGDHYICIDIGGNLLTCYGHGSAQLVNAGDHVEAGQPVATEGCEGSCTGPHLHFEIRTGLWGPVQDPVPFLAAHGVRLG